MFREFVILLCAAVFVCSSPVRPVTRNAPAQSPLPTSGPVNTSKQSADADSQDNTALPSDTSYQSVLPPAVRYLPEPSPSYEVKPAVVQTISEPAPAAKSVAVQSYGSTNPHQAVSFSTSVATDPDNNNILESYVGSAPPIQPYYSVPVAAQSVTIGSHGAVNAHPPAAYAAHNYNVGSAVAYASNAAPARPYYAVPLAANKVTVEAHRSVNVHPSAQYVTHHVAPAVAYATNPAPAVAYATNPAPAVAYATNPAPARPYHAANTVESHGAVAAHSPAVVSYPVNHVQTVVNRPLAQYVPTPGIRYNVNPAVPVASKSVTLEAYNSVIAHPPPAPKYATVPAHIGYASAPVPVAKPVPVPVIYQASGVAAHHHSAAPYVQAQHIPVPVNHGGAAVQYNPVPIPVVHADSFIENVYAPVGPRPNPVPSAGHGHSYAKALTYSPASAVSRVTFNGLGVSYGW